VEHETFLDLVKDLPHWEFEILVSFCFMGFEGLLFWPLIRMWRKHHKKDDKATEDLQARHDALEKRIRLIEGFFNKDIK